MSINTQFKEILESGGRNVYSYSGRAMYGKKCLAFDLDGSIPQEMAQLSTDIMNYCLDNLPNNYADDLCNEMENFFDIISEAKTDDMGLGTVIYFPNVEWEEDEDDEEESENENDEDDKDYD